MPHKRSLWAALTIFIVGAASTWGGQITDRAKRAEEAMTKLGYAPKVETLTLGERLQYQSPGKLKAGGSGLSLTVFLLANPDQARGMMDAVCGMYLPSTYGPAEKIDVGLTEQATVYTSLGGWLTDPPYWVPYGHIGGHAICGSAYIAVTQEKAAAAPTREQTEARTAGRLIASSLRLDAVSLLRKLAQAMVDAKACQ